MPEAIVALGEGKRAVGRLRLESDGRRQHSQFEYASEWLAAPDRFALSPGLPLREGSHYSAGRSDRRSALPGCFADAAPDSWGRALMTRALGGGLSEFDYLVLSNDRTRQGALRFLGDDMRPVSDLTPPDPRLVDLGRLRTLAHRFERDPGGAVSEARDLAPISIYPPTSIAPRGAYHLIILWSRPTTQGIAPSWQRRLGWAANLADGARKNQQHDRQTRLCASALRLGRGFLN